MIEINKDLWEIKSRYLIMFFIISYVLGAIIWSMITPSFMDDNPPPLSEVSFFYFVYTFLFYFGYKLSKKANVDIKDLIGVRNNNSLNLKYLLLVIPLIGFSIGCLYLIFYPLSFWFPEFIQYWIIDNEINLLWLSGEHYKLANYLSYFSIAIFTPIWEEIFFRGFLFTSLSLKWNTKVAAIISSILFGLGHGDIIGATFFGIVLVYIYQITNSLVIPILIHIINNTIVYMIVGYSQIFLEATKYTLMDFQNDWWMGLVGLIISLPWFLYFYKNDISGKNFNIPYFYNKGV